MFEKKYSLFFITIFKIVFIFCNKSDHYMMIGLPRSGSTFFMNQVAQAHQETAYRNEFFSNFLYKDYISKLLHKEPFILKNIYNESLNPVLTTVYKNKWIPSKIVFTKEVFNFFFIPFFSEHFTLWCLYRTRKHTFPTPERFQSIYQFMFCNFIKTPHFNDTILQAIQEHLKKEILTRLEQQCAAHIIASFILLRHCDTYQIPVIEYSQMMVLNKQDLGYYLAKRIPGPLFNNELLEAITNNRKQDTYFLQKREAAYQKLDIEPFCQQLVTFIKNLYPKMQYWYLLS